MDCIILASCEVRTLEKERTEENRAIEAEAVEVAEPVAPVEMEEVECALYPPTAARNKILHDVNKQEILTLLYPSGKLEKGASITWQCSSTDPGNYFGELGKGLATYRTSLLTIDTVYSKIIFVCQTAPIDVGCHQCGALIDIGILDSVGSNKWRVSFIDNIDQLGSWGGAPPFKILTFGDNQFGVLFDSGNTHMGYTTSDLFLYVFMEGGFKKLFEFYEAGVSNDGVTGVESEQWAYESQFEFEEAEAGLLPPIKITRSGTRKDEGGKINEFSEDFRFEFGNSKYEEVK